MSLIKPALIFHCVCAYLVGLLLGTSGLLPKAPTRALPDRHAQVLQVQQVAAVQPPSPAATRLR